MQPNPRASAPDAERQEKVKPPKPASLDTPPEQLNHAGNDPEPRLLEGEPPAPAIDDGMPMEMPHPALGGAFDPDAEEPGDVIFGGKKVRRRDLPEGYDPQTNPDDPLFDPTRPKKIIVNRGISPKSRMTY